MERKKEVIVVKAGSSSVSDHEIGLNTVFIDSAAEQLSFLWCVGYPVIMVSSGAVAAGRYQRGRRMHEYEKGQWLWFTESRLRHENLQDKEVSAIFGQPKLIEEYERAFERYGVIAGQVLLTGDDLGKLDPLRSSLDIGVPIVNANDPLNREEMVQYGDAKDNDRLAGCVAEKVKAHKLILLTDQPGVLDTYNNNQTISSITSEREFQRAIRIVNKWNGRFTESTGGMSSKLDVAWRAALLGIDVWIAQASEKDVIMKIMDGERVGTHVYVPDLKR